MYYFSFLSSHSNSQLKFISIWVNMDGVICLYPSSMENTSMFVCKETALKSLTISFLLEIIFYFSYNKFGNFKFYENNY